MLKIILAASLVILQAFPAYAELSSNPWLTANDEQDIKKVYEKRTRRGRINTPIEQYQTEEETIIDRTHAYIQEDDELLRKEEDTSFLDKVKNALTPSPKSETRLIANTKDNRRKLAEQKQQQAAAQQAEQQEKSLLPSIDLGSLTNNFKLPNLNTTGMIKKFEKASGINLKSIGKQFK